MRFVLVLIFTMQTFGLTPAHMRRYPLPKAIQVEKELVSLKERVEGYINLKPQLDISSVKLLLRPSLPDTFEMELVGADGTLIPVIWDGVDGHVDLGPVKKDQLRKLRLFIRKKTDFSLASISLVFQFDYPVQWATDLVLSNPNGIYSNPVASEILIRSIQSMKQAEEISNFVLTGNQF